MASSIISSLSVTVIKCNVVDGVPISTWLLDLNFSSVSLSRLVFYVSFNQRNITFFKIHLMSLCVTFNAVGEYNN